MNCCTPVTPPDLKLPSRPQGLKARPRMQLPFIMTSAGTAFSPEAPGAGPTQAESNFAPVAGLRDAYTASKARTSNTPLCPLPLHPGLPSPLLPPCRSWAARSPGSSAGGERACSRACVTSEGRSSRHAERRAGLAEMWELAQMSETVSSTQRLAGAAAGGGVSGAGLSVAAAAVAVVVVGRCCGGDTEDEAGVHRTSKRWRETASSPRRMACRGSIPGQGTGGVCPLRREIAEALFKFASVHCQEEAVVVEVHSVPRRTGIWKFRETVVGGPLLTTMSSAHPPRSPPLPLAVYGRVRPSPATAFGGQM